MNTRVTIPPDVAGRGASAQRDANPFQTSGVIAIFERSNHFEPLANIVTQLNYQVVPGMSLEATNAACDNMHVAAAIVSDAIADPLRLCASMFPGTPKILVATEPTFAFRLAAARADVSAIVGRPVNVNELADWLEHFASEQSVAPISILIVDDDDLAAEFHAAILRKAGMQVTVATDPAAAVKSVESALPDMVLMDVQMPDVDGIELARIIRQARQYLALPILFLSAERDIDRQLEARRYGGDVFIKKPVDPLQLVSLVRLRADRARALRSMIERDSLTGLYNHGRFKDRIAHELERCRRIGAEFTLAMIDIDHFKQVNDTYGHPVGDRVIRTLSRVLTSGVRKIDIVGRYGGEEFGIILLDSPPLAALTVVDNLRKRFCDVAFDAAGRQFGAAFSAGVAGSRDCTTLQQLVARADEALYSAKRAGRNRVELAV
ncbi:MAG: diguanylate cyclase [Alphaproteobacteria bacterium]|nr:diguanylate cyclase [Alphaproteobacteria bacterium]